MGQINYHSVQFRVDPPLEPGRKISIHFSPSELMLHGFNLPVTISTASVFRERQKAENFHLWLILIRERV